MKAALVLLLVPALAYAGFFDGIPGVGDLGNMFGSGFEGAKSVFANNQNEMEGNVGKVSSLLRGIQGKMGVLEVMANDSQKATLRQVGGWLKMVDSFQSQIRNDGAQKFDQNKSRWQDMAKNIFETGGLNEIVKLIAKASGSTSSCLIAAITIPMVYLLR